MDFVVDANIVISALIASHGKSFELLLNDRINLFAPEFMLDEVAKYKEVILNKSGLLSSEFDLFLDIISSRITFIQKNEFTAFLKSAGKITPDPNDVEYFGTGCEVEVCALE
ncbi:MAG: PIN domain-containing protein [Candidatus Woesearchaeota archaeon]